MVTQAISTDVGEAIAAANKKFMVNFSQGDAAGLAAMYTDSGQVLPPNSDTLAGKAAIQSFWQALMDMGSKTAKLEIIEVEGHDDTAIEVSTYTLEDVGGHVLDQGKYMVIWKQEKGQWKLHRDIFNSSLTVPND